MKRITMVAALILCACGKPGAQDAFSQCWGVLKKGLDDGQATYGQAANITEKPGGAYDRRWEFEYEVSYDSSYFHRLPIEAAANYESGRITFCIAWREGETCFVWAR